MIPRAVPAVLLVTIFGLAPTADADEGDRALSLSLSYATFTAPDAQPHGAVLGFDYERGFSGVMSFRVSGGAGAYDGDGKSFSAHAALGLTYLFDVVKYVPYANIGAGAIVIGGGAVETDVLPLLELGLGLDVLRSRAFSFGPQIRFESFITETSFFTAGLRLTWRWGFF